MLSSLEAAFSRWEMGLLTEESPHGALRDMQKELVKDTEMKLLMSLQQ